MQTVNVHSCKLLIIITRLLTINVIVARLQTINIHGLTNVHKASPGKSKLKVWRKSNEKTQIKTELSNANSANCINKNK